MLYVTTREKYDAFTAPRTLAGDCGPDGGRFLPFQIPVFSTEEIYALKEKSFGQCVSEMLNRFFSTRLTPWDVEFSVGRHPVKIATATGFLLLSFGAISIEATEKWSDALRQRSETAAKRMWKLLRGFGSRSGSP